MIYDHINNVRNYMGLSAALDIGLDYLSKAISDQSFGTVEICDDVKATISEYTTKEINENGFETHRRYIDIQMPLYGLERIDYMSEEPLKETKPYNEDNDIAFCFSESKPVELTIGNGYFAIFFPQDGHMPQLCVDEPELIKKLTLKVNCK